LLGNLKKWQSWNPLAVLPPTFRDFVSAAGRLGFRYVWIDSLCIIQGGDSGVDWDRESQTMDLVYRSSSCNFAADWPSEETGLFNSRDPRQADDLAVTLSVKKTEGGKATSCPYLLSEPFETRWDVEVRNAPLNKRGWVLQERFLSPRILHFGRFEVLLECCELWSAERHHLTGPPDSPRLSGMNFKRLETDTTLGINHSAYWIWIHIRYAYEYCQLTVASDRLVAVSGIARYLRPFSPGCNYVMGVWTWMVEEQAAWCRKPALDDRQKLETIDELSPATRLAGLPSVIASTPYRAPSFSWASVDDAKLSPFDVFVEKTPVVNAVIINYRDNCGTDDIPVCEDIYDFLPAGSTPKVEMRVIGRLNRARLVSDGGDWFYAWPEVEDFDLANASREPFLCGRREGLYRRVSLDFYVTLDDVPDIEAGMYYYMIWSGSRPKIDTSMPIEEPICLIFALIDPDMGRFRRIGWMDLNPICSSVDAYKDQQLAAGSEQATIPCWAYDRETNQHTIYVV
jgi:hypothetical protein